jgi:YVTN family beta-propeller protein
MADPQKWCWHRVKEVRHRLRAGELLGRPALALASLAVAFAMLSLPCQASASANRPLFAYVTSKDPDALSVVNTATGTVARTIPVDGVNGAPTFTPNGAFAYVPVASPQAGDGTVAVVKTSTGAVVSRIRVGIDPTSVAIAPNGKYAYVANFLDPNGEPGSGPLSEDDSSVSIINTSTHAVVATPDVGYEPTSVAVTPNGRFAYVASYKASLAPVSIIDAATRKASPVTDSTGASLIYATDIAISPNGAFAYVADTSGVSVISTAGKRVIASIRVEHLVGAHLAVSPDGAYTYVTSDGQSWNGYSSGVVSVISNATKTIVSNIAVGDRSAGLSDVMFAPNGTYAYVTNRGDQSIAVIDTAAKTVVSTWPVGVYLEGVAVKPAAPPCGKSLAERLKCAVGALKGVASCGLDVAGFVPLRALRGVKVIKGIYETRNVRRALRPVYELYNDVMSLRFKNGMTGADLWNSIRFGKTVYKVVVAVAHGIAVGVDIHDRQFDKFIEDFAKLVGVDGCLALFQGSA